MWSQTQAKYTAGILHVNAADRSLSGVDKRRPVSKEVYAAAYP